MIDLLQPVRVKVPTGDVVEWKRAVLVGRVIIEPPLYDVRLDDGGVLVNVEAERVKVAA